MLIIIKDFIKKYMYLILAAILIVVGIGIGIYKYVNKSEPALNEKGQGVLVEQLEKQLVEKQKEVKKLKEELKTIQKEYANREKVIEYEEKIKYVRAANVPDSELASAFTEQVNLNKQRSSSGSTQSTD